MDPFELRQLARSGVRATALGLGGATLGNIREAIPESRAEATIASAVEGGIGFFDTAPWYGVGLSEHRMGHALRWRPRDKFVLSTKVGRLLRPPGERDGYRNGRWPLALGFEPAFDYSAAGIVRSYEDSLARLGLNRVDALVIHDLDFLYHDDEAGVSLGFEQLGRGGGFDALESMRGSGEIGAIGAGINTTGLIPRFLDQFDLDFFIVAMPYTLLDQDGLEELELCHRRGVRVVIGAPFASGVLAGGATYNYGALPDAARDRAQKLREACARHGVPAGAAALQFVLAHPAVASVIPGPDSPEQVVQNIEWVRQPVPPALWADLLSRGLIREGSPLPATP